MTGPDDRFTSASVWKLVVGFFIVVIAAVAGAMAVRASSRRHRRFQNAIRLWQETAPDRRRARFESLTGGAEPDAPAWYLLGCAYLQEGKPRLAARAFGVAHHANYSLETAALLTFACLKASEGPNSDIVEQLMRTWHEMREPDLIRHRDDRIMLECLGSTESAPPLSPLGRLIWLTVSPNQREKINKLTANGCPDAKSLRPSASSKS